MGFEYKIKFAYSNREAVTSLLRRLPQTQEVIEAAQERFEFRDSEPRRGMPDAMAMVQPYGIYFCDNGNGKHVLGLVVEVLISNFGQVTVVDLES